MDNINIRFLEEYKRLDKLCRELYNADKGVTLYIEDMKNESSPYKKDRPEWQSSLKSLIDIRHKRNILTHEPDTLGTDIVSESEILFVKKFRQSILESSDPMSTVIKIHNEKKTTLQNRTEQYPAETENNTRDNRNFFVIWILLIAFMIFLIYEICK